MSYAGTRRIIDVDSHLIELEDFLFKTASAEEKALIPSMLDQKPVIQKRERLEMGRAQFQARQGDPALAAEYEAQILDNTKVGWGRLGAFDPVERSRAIDLFGYEIQLVLATFTFHQFYNNPDPEVRLAGTSALNRALGAFCKDDPRMRAVGYQPLHSDVSDWINPSISRFSSFHDPRCQLTIRDLPCPYVCVNFLPQDVTALNGPTRQIPGTQHSRVPIPMPEQEPEWMRLSTVCPAPAGAIMVRDARAWHGGTPNLSDAIRYIPNLEFYAPWFHEPMVPGISYRDRQKLSERAQFLTRFCAADSSMELNTGAVLFAP